MNFPDAVTILRPSGEDEFGNPSSSFASPASTTVRGFVPDRATAFLPAGTDVRVGDRLRVNGSTFAVQAEPEPIRSPSKTVLVLVTLAPLEV